ncbi:MAG: hypothetical protein MUF54_00065 [Polyangiaceae bacterium]|jgi:hypothetical protein|nr:hypothetical protein [Polyangiaceae bacterium]
MTLTELIAAFRDLADDTAEPYLWSDSVLTRFANEAQEEACRRGRLIVDSTTEEVCQLDVTGGTAVYPVDPRVLFIRRVKLDSMDMPIRKTSVDDLDLMSPGWEGELPGVPFVWAPYEVGKILLFPPPEVDDTMRLTVVRLPLDDMVGGLTPVDPEIPARYHMKLVDWMLFRALSMRDKEERHDPEGAKAHLRMFEEEFGQRSNAVDETWIAQKHGFDPFEGLF